MRTFSLCLALALSTAVFNVAQAHEDHPPQRPSRPALTEATAKVQAKEEVKKLVGNKKIPASWADIDAKAIDKRSYEHGRWEWLVTFENAKLKEKNTLYVFLAPTGELAGANFTGKQAPPGR